MSKFKLDELLAKEQAENETKEIGFGETIEECWICFNPSKPTIELDGIFSVSELEEILDFLRRQAKAPVQ